MGGHGVENQILFHFLLFSPVLQTDFILTEQPPQGSELNQADLFSLNHGESCKTRDCTVGLCVRWG